MEKLSDSALDNHSGSMAAAETPAYITAAAQHGIRLRQSAPPRPGPRAMDLPILRYLRSHRVVLASASPRRRALLAQVGLTNVGIMPSSLPEDLPKSLYGPREYVEATARRKCMDVYEMAVKDAATAASTRRQEHRQGKKMEEQEEKKKKKENNGEQGEGARLLQDEIAATATKGNIDQGTDFGNDNRGDDDDGSPHLVIAADTVIVARDGRILEKPRSAAEHGAMLRGLRDQVSHRVLTAVCCMAPRRDAAYPGYALASAVEETTVFFGVGGRKGRNNRTGREGDDDNNDNDDDDDDDDTDDDNFLLPLDDDVIDSYVQTREGADKAGGYAIQGIAGLLLVSRVEGSVDNVVGLPVRLTLALAEQVIFRQQKG